MYNDAIRVIMIKPALKTGLAKKTVVAQRKFEPIDVKSLNEHSSLGRILDYILKFGDSPDLRDAISEHIKTHTRNANTANYLIVLYACLAKDVPLLNYLVMQQKLPLRYTIDTTKEDTAVWICWDLKTEESIAALAAHEFIQYGQPLDAFPELFRKSIKETQGIVNKLKDAYKEIAPIIDAEKPLQDDIDELFNAFVKQGAISAIAYILPKASEEAVSNAFFETDNVGVLRLVTDRIESSDLFGPKIEASIRDNNVKAVEFLLPFYLRYDKREIEKDLLRTQRAGLDITGISVKASLPDGFLDVAYDKSAVEVIQLLAPFTKESTTNRLLLKAVENGQFARALVLARLATADAISTAIEEASTSNHAVLAKALFEEYAHNKPVEVMFLKAVEEGNLDDLEKWMPSVSAGIIGYALFNAAEKGEMDCFERLVPQSTGKSINAALSKLSDENLKHRSVLKAVNNASRLSAYKEIIERATNVELVVHMLPFMSTFEVDSFFETACKNEKSFEIVKQLFQVVASYSISSCLETAVEKKMEKQVKLLLPRGERENVVEISHTPEFEKLGDDTRQAIEDRIKNFPTEVAIELAFLPKDGDDFRASLKDKLGKDKSELACMDQESCIKMINSMDPLALMFPIEQAVERLSWSEENNAALEDLLSFATPRACMEIMAHFSEHGSEKATKGCAKKALKSAVPMVVRSAQRNGDFELVKFLAPLLPPLEIIELLEPRFSSQKIDADGVKAILAGLPEGLADDALRIAVRGDEEERKLSVPYLLLKASQAAIDEVYLFAKRIKFDDESLEKSASDKAKDQAREMEKAMSTK